MAELSEEERIEAEGNRGPEDESADADDWDHSGEVLTLPQVDMRERALPIRPGDLTRLLMAQPGLSDGERKILGQFCRMLGAIFHSEFYERLRDLKEHYASLDPDSDYLTVQEIAPPSEHADELFLKQFEATLERANYHPLDLDVIRAAVAAPNELGLNYVPDFGLFEHLRIYVRGFTQITRHSRSIRNRFRKRTVTLDAYQRLIIALKFRPDVKRAGPHVRSDVFYLRLFKDVPHVDMEMHLPEQGTKVRMRLLDKAQIASPFAVGIPTLILKGLGLISSGGIAGFVIAPISAGINSFFGFQRAKQKHMTYMIRNLYYLTLANNASVLTRVVDAAEEEEYKETLLSYYFLWRTRRDSGDTWDQTILDRSIESFLKEKTGREVNFEIGDALGKLFRLGLARRDARGILHPRPLRDALGHLDRLWDNTYHYTEIMEEGGLDEVVKT